ncbi:hypothetical protein [Marinobacter sp. F4216]|uniref:hypothetical protein n=1 Tax=Marinobacter sp. F4216 TaxID=2874281 RepID=UPI001CBB6C6B|nr:hypothetical protein [Marinobacter sp. F4216]MBZ2168770.1 hypothetical protein [Marinobacter sp. F4216]
MKWIILIIIIVALAYWLNRGRLKNNVEDPELKTFEKKNYYLTPDDNSSDDDSSSGNSNPRH